MLHYFGGANFSKDRASFLPLPHVINGERIQHHTLKPQPRWKGAKNNETWETYLEVGRQRKKKARTKQTPPWKCFL